MEDHAASPQSPPGELTRLLSEMRQGHLHAREALFPLVYDELRRLAAARLRSPDFRRLQSGKTSIVHEAYLRLGGQDLPIENRKQFFGYMAQVMRNLLVDKARANKVQLGAVELREMAAPRSPETDPSDGLEQALAEMRTQHADLADLIEMHYLGGIGIRDLAAALGKAERTVKLHLHVAREILREKLK